MALRIAVDRLLRLEEAKTDNDALLAAIDRVEELLPNSPASLAAKEYWQLFCSNTSKCPFIIIFGKQLVKNQHNEALSRASDGSTHCS